MLRLLVAAVTLMSASIVSGATFAPSDAVLLDTGGSLTISPDPGSGPYAANVGAGAEYTACVESTDNCATNGLSISIDLSDTLAAITFVLSGATGTGGSFTLELSDLDFLPAGTIIGVAPLGYPLIEGTFGWTAFNGNSITFEGSGLTDINAGRGFTAAFDIEVQPDAVVPAPSALLLFALGLAAAGFTRRRTLR